MQQRNLYDWLIVVFLHEIQNDKTYSDLMKAAIQAAGCGGNNAIFLVQDTVTPLENESEYSFRLSVSRLEKIIAGEWVFLPVTSSGLRIENQKKNCWEDALKYIYSNYFGERNMLITFSEGSAFAINGDPGFHVVRPSANAPQGFIQLPAAASEGVPATAGTQDRGALSGATHKVLTNKYYVLDKEEIQKLSADPTLLPEGTIQKKGDLWVIGKEPDSQLCKNLEVLWMSQLARALEHCLYGQNIDILLMSNCFMQLFDNGYTLSNKVKYLVGAEGPMSMRGYDFGKLMDTLNKTPGIKGEELVRQIIGDLKQMYRDQKDDYALRTATIYANRLKFYPLALKVFEDMLAHLEPLLPVIAPQLADIRNRMKNVSTYANYPLVDAGYWIQLVTTEIKELGGDYYHRMFSGLQSRISVDTALDPLSAITEENDLQKYGYSGLSLYYPDDNKLHAGQEIGWCAYFDNATPAPFRTHSKWNIFLNRYFAALAKSKSLA